MENTIISAIIITGGVGVLAAVLLVVASKVMHVEVNPTVQLLRDALPGANCGACGFSGCDGYATALAGGEVTPDLCPPGGEETYKSLCEILGIAVGDAPIKKIALVRCTGTREVKSDKMEYEGIDSCLAAEQLYGGHNACTFGCLGYGDCATACPNEAICVADKIARVNISRCTGCGMCLSACPRNVITIREGNFKTAVLCQNTEKGAVVRKKCGKGCIACAKCARECHAQAIAMVDNLAVIDNSKCDGCGHCAEICVVGCISDI